MEGFQCRQARKAMLAGAPGFASGGSKCFFGAWRGCIGRPADDPAQAREQLRASPSNREKTFVKPSGM